MANKKTLARNPWLRILAAFAFILSLLGFLGTFGISKPGIAVFAFLSLVFGKFAWIVPYVFLAISFYSWINSWQWPSEPRKQNQRDKNRFKKQETYKRTDTFIHSKGKITLPPTKLVQAKGFKEYFITEDWPEIVSTPPIDNTELGRDFSTYFGEGQTADKYKMNLTTLRGFRSYFEKVDEEVKEENRINEVTSPTLKRKNEMPTVEAYSNKQDERRQVLKDEPYILESIPTAAAIEESSVYPGQVANLVELSVKQVEKKREMDGVTTEEREILLGKKQSHKLSGNNLIQESIMEDEMINITWELPLPDILEPISNISLAQDTETSKRLESVLLDFGVKAKVIRVSSGPVITRFELAPAPGIKVSKIVNLADDIALALAANDVRIEAPIPGKAAIGIEIPNKNSRAVNFREVVDSPAFKQNTSKLKIALGKDIANQAIVGDLSKMPHLLVAGATGSGKSVCITSIINSLLFNDNPDELKLLLIDPKMVELNQYNGIPHLIAPVVTDPQKAASALKWIVKEMENRYEIFASAGVRDIGRYNQIKHTNKNETDSKPLPWIVVIIDELADLMLVAAGDVEEAICRLAQMARAAGIHLVIATQRPSVDVITGLIKANIPSRISFAVSSQIDSRTILDSVGAEKLIGKGDMLYSPLGLSKPMRVQGCFVTDEEVEKMINHWKTQGKPDYLDPERLFIETEKKADENNSFDDELFVEAGRLLINTGMASVTFLQRRLKLGYARAARLIDMLEEHGIVGPYEGAKPRQIMITLEDFEERFGNVN